jgi:hypothetical protein
MMRLPFIRVRRSPHLIFQAFGWNFFIITCLAE